VSAENVSELTGTIDAETLAVQATRYLEAVDLLRSLELEVTWRSEVDEAPSLSPPASLQQPRRCEYCASPMVRINGQHICLRA
jgi:hypothetical protein